MKTSIKNNTIKSALLSSAIILGVASQASAFNSSTTKNYGNSRFGATVNLTLSDLGSNAATYKMEANAKVNAKILGATPEAASATGSVSVNANATGKVAGALRVRGITVESYNRDFNSSMSFDTGAFTQTFSAGQEFLRVGNLVPLKLKGSVSVRASVDGEGSITAGSASGPNVNARITPHFDVSATATASSAGSFQIFGIELASATVGVTGSAKLVGVDVPVHVTAHTLVTQASNGAPNVAIDAVDYDVDLDIETPSGTVIAFARFSVLGQNIRHQRTLCSFNGSNLHFNVAQGTVEF